MDEVTSAFQANVFSILRVSKVVLPHMASRKQGLIINIGSIVGEMYVFILGVYTLDTTPNGSFMHDRPTPFSGIYSATKVKPIFALFPIPRTN